MIRTCKSHTSMHESTGMGMGWGQEVLCGDGWDDSQMYGDGVGMEKIL